MAQRRRVQDFLFVRKTIGGKSRRFGFVNIIQEKKFEGWTDISWDDFDTPRELHSYPDETLPVPQEPTFPFEHQGWGEDHVARGAYTIAREVPARLCTFAIWVVNGSNHPGFARIYGKGNAQRIADTLTACDGMDDPVQEVQVLKARPSTLLQALQSASPEEVAAALISLSETREGLAYDVGMALYEAGAGKDMPGPAWDWYPSGDQEFWLEFASYDPARRMDALRGLRKALMLSLVEAKSLLDTLDKGHGHSGERVGYLSQETLEDLRACGFDVQLASSGEVPPTSHRVSLHDLSRGPIG